MYRRVAEAAEVRGLSISKKNFRRALLMLEQLISMSLLQSCKISLAMELRSYSPYRSIKLSKFKELDWILIGISAILFLF
jgi:energy-coupling factor transporter transmembrane protein EcfT